MADAREAAMQTAADAHKRKDRPVLTGLLFLLIYFVVQLLVTLPYAVAGAFRVIAETGVTDFAAFQARLTELLATGGELITAISDVLSLGAFLLALRLMKRPLCEALWLHRVPAARLVALVPLGLSLNLFCTSLISLLPKTVLDAYMQAAGQVLPAGFSVWSALLVAVVAPLTEEVLFRALIYGNFRRGMPRALAVCASAALFGIMHGQPLWMLYTAALAALLCLLMERQRSLVGCVVLHAAFNAGSFLVLALAAVPLLPVLAASGAVCAILLYYTFQSEAPAKTPTLY